MRKRKIPCDAGRSAAAAATWAGRAASGAVIVVLGADAGVQLLAPTLLAAEMAALAFPVGLAPIVGVILLAALLLYAVPPTAVVGAVLLTGFLGGAIAVHLRVGEIGTPPQLICVLIGIAAWGGMWLREPRLRVLLPLRVLQ